MFKVFIWTVILGIVGYGMWYAYQRWWGTGEVEKFVEVTSKNIENTARSKMKEVSTAVASDTLSSARTFLGDTVGKLLLNAGGAIQNAGVSLRGSSPSATETIPVLVTPPLASGTIVQPTSTSFYIPPPPATIMTKVSVPLSFSINSGNSYTVDWGDGTAAERGDVVRDKVMIINHIWNKEGDYTVKMVIMGNGSTSTYSFPVRVYQ